MLLISSLATVIGPLVSRLPEFWNHAYSGILLSTKMYFSYGLYVRYCITFIVK